MIVMKFGGTSVESAEAIERVTAIVKSRLNRKPVVVVSAMGKTTNRLLKIADLAVSGQREEALRELFALRDFHLRESNMERTVDEHFQELSELVKGLAALGELTPRSIDASAQAILARVRKASVMSGRSSRKSWRTAMTLFTIESLQSNWRTRTQSGGS